MKQVSSSAEHIPDLLWPLPLLRQCEMVRITGLPDDIHSRVQRQMQDYEQIYRTLCPGCIQLVDVLIEGRPGTIGTDTKRAISDLAEEVRKARS